MDITAKQIEKLIEAELGCVADIRVVRHIRSLLIKPRLLFRQWDYGEENTNYPCWNVLEHKASNTAICYSELGYGPMYPWGLVFLDGDNNEMSMGMDSGWFPIFVETYFDSFAAYEVPIWRVFRQIGDEYPGEPLSEESDSESTWEKVLKLREADKLGRYHHHHSIKYAKSKI